MTEQSSTLPSSSSGDAVQESVSIAPPSVPEKQMTMTPEEETSQNKPSSHTVVSNTTATESAISENTLPHSHSSNETIEEPPTPIEAPKSTIPEVVETVDDIYDFDGLSGRNTTLYWLIDFEKDLEDVDLEDVDLEGVDMSDMDDIEKDILDELWVVIVLWLFFFCCLFVCLFVCCFLNRN